jgi:hypothetical protein
MLAEQSSSITLGERGTSSELDETSSGNESIEEVLIRHFNTITPNSLLVRTSIVRAAAAMNKQNTRMLQSSLAILRSARGKADDATNEVIDGLLDLSSHD